MAKKPLQAKTSRKKNPAGGGGSSSFDIGPVLVVIFLLFLIVPIVWYFWPQPPGSPIAEREKRKLKEMTTQHPDAEVFDLGGGEKKK